MNNNKILPSKLLSAFEVLRSSRGYLLISAVFSLNMVCFRIIFTGSFYYAFLVWNLFLAFIPVWISIRVVKMSTRKWYNFLLPGFFWLLFLPNAPYLITDFVHLEENENIPHWFDLMLILSFAWNGLLFWLISMFHFNTLLGEKLNSNLKTALNHFIILLSAVGVYLGRYGRFNSWDAFIAPIDILEKVGQIIAHPARYTGFYGMTIAVYVFLALLFGFFEKIRQTGISELLTQTQRHEVH